MSCFGGWSQPIDATLYLREKRWSVTVGSKFLSGRRPHVTPTRTVTEKAGRCQGFKWLAMEAVGYRETGLSIVNLRSAIPNASFWRGRDNRILVSEFPLAFGRMATRLHLQGAKLRVRHTRRPSYSSTRTIPGPHHVTAISGAPHDAGKPEGIHLIIGRRPNAVFGNSTGDQQMLETFQQFISQTHQL
jgi:hypothetical protein